MLGLFLLGLQTDAKRASYILSILSPSSETDVFGFLSLFVFFMGGVLARKGRVLLHRK